MSTRAPILIALEGLDGSGTTTQCALLAEWLGRRGRSVHATREPSDGPAGRLLREILRGDHGSVDAGAVALLFAADRLDHLKREIRPALARGCDVVTDRYVLSSLAYQSIECPLEWVERLNERAEDAELTLFLDVPVERCLERMARRNRGTELFERAETLAQVEAAYRRLVGERSVVVVDGTPAAERVAEAIFEEVGRVLGLS